MKNFIPRPFASEMYCRRAPCGTTKSEIAIVPKPFVSPELINTFVADNNTQYSLPLFQWSETRHEICLIFNSIQSKHLFSAVNLHSLSFRIRYISQESFLVHQLS